MTTTDNATGVIPATRAEHAVIACAETFRGGGEILASAFGIIPSIGVRLARSTFEPELLLSDGEANLVHGTGPIPGALPGPVEGFIPFRRIFDILWNGRRHVMMVPSQLDRYGNSNISAIGDHARPKVQLLGVRGAPGNSVCHPTSYWVPRHSTRVFVDRVDFVCGVGNDRAAANGPAASRYHDLRKIVTDLAVLGYREDGTIRLISVHPGVSVDDVVRATGFELGDTSEVTTTREPTPDELHLIREILDPMSLRDKEVPT
ncbi:acyl CoA:acetate/3-ketoacid CoA transferase beta subunit [Branchiibius hedensis]|uniref:Acyl CoA:acetate/3-ketoacid CoA transferase, beta subunit n=1 Tax=Branchiibius hedensis TaxID=672460 RepID=A0A2Y9BUK2_9MICO|nr:CoA-transferase [Branchiibius hedensis]PWJ27041.1 acyl CoA:acetate/3-ketoacid CoA transferase beta subunit [Branchiibius hedensis]SSA35852.1 Acyl CoA:acetate/3-ketoacid CoA transferase, beta subunit [Branchiibius hedensis]